MVTKAIIIIADVAFYPRAISVPLFELPEPPAVCSSPPAGALSPRLRQRSARLGSHFALQRTTRRISRTDRAEVALLGGDTVGRAPNADFDHSLRQKPTFP